MVWLFWVEKYYKYSQNSCQVCKQKAGAGRHSPPLREQLEEHYAQRDVDEKHEDNQLLPGKPVLKKKLNIRDFCYVVIH